MPANRDKWTAFLLSLALPGVGQLWAGSVTCLVWFVLAGMVAAFWLSLAADGGAYLPVLIGQVITLAAVSICSAEHAKRLLEQSRSRSPSGTMGSCSASKTYSANNSNSACCHVRRRGRAIEARIELQFEQSPETLWQKVSNLHEFLTIDPFHEQIVLARDKPAAGVHVVLWHNAFGCRFPRFGRILSWNEGEGYAFSDLSRHGSRRGFPHVFSIAVSEPTNGNESSKLSITVRGKWTSRLAPPAIGRVWIWLVCREHARLLRKGL